MRKRTRFLVDAPWRRLAGAATVALIVATGELCAQQPLDPITLRLFEAVHHNDLATVQRAILDGADPTALNEWGLTAADVALDKGYFQIARYLMSIAGRPVQRVAPRMPMPTPPPPMARPPYPGPPPMAWGPAAPRPMPRLPQSGPQPAAPHPAAPRQAAPEPAPSQEPAPQVSPAEPEASPPVEPPPPEPRPEPEVVLPEPVQPEPEQVETEQAEPEASETKAAEAPSLLDRLGALFGSEPAPEAETEPPPEEPGQPEAEPEPTAPGEAETPSFLDRLQSGLKGLFEPEPPLPEPQPEAEPAQTAEPAEPSAEPSSPGEVSDETKKLLAEFDRQLSATRNLEHELQDLTGEEPADQTAPPAEASAPPPEPAQEAAPEAAEDVPAALVQEPTAEETQAWAPKVRVESPAEAAPEATPEPPPAPEPTPEPEPEPVAPAEEAGEPEEPPEAAEVISEYEQQLAETKRIEAELQRLMGLEKSKPSTAETPPPPQPAAPEPSPETAEAPTEEPAPPPQAQAEPEPEPEAPPAEEPATPSFLDRLTSSLQSLFGSEEAPPAEMEPPEAEPPEPETPALEPEPKPQTAMPEPGAEPAPAPVPTEGEAETETAPEPPVETDTEGTPPDEEEVLSAYERQLRETQRMEAELRQLLATGKAPSTPEEESAPEPSESEPPAEPAPSAADERSLFDRMTSSLRHWISPEEEKPEAAPPAEEAGAGWAPEVALPEGAPDRAEQGAEQAVAPPAETAPEAPPVAEAAPAEPPSFMERMRTSMNRLFGDEEEDAAPTPPPAPEDAADWAPKVSEPAPPAPAQAPVPAEPPSFGTRLSQALGRLLGEEEEAPTPGPPATAELPPPPAEPAPQVEPAPPESGWEPTVAPPMPEQTPAEAEPPLEAEVPPEETVPDQETAPAVEEAAPEEQAPMEHPPMEPAPAPSPDVGGWAAQLRKRPAPAEPAPEEMTPRPAASRDLARAPEPAEAQREQPTEPAAEWTPKVTGSAPVPRQAGGDGVVPAPAQPHTGFIARLEEGIRSLMGTPEEDPPEEAPTETAPEPKSWEPQVARTPESAPEERTPPAEPGRPEGWEPTLNRPEEPEEEGFLARLEGQVHRLLHGDEEPPPAPGTPESAEGWAPQVAERADKGWSPEVSQEPLPPPEEEPAKPSFLQRLQSQLGRLLGEDEKIVPPDQVAEVPPAEEEVAPSPEDEAVQDPLLTGKPGTRITPPADKAEAIAALKNLGISDVSKYIADEPLPEPGTWSPATPVQPLPPQDQGAEPFAPDDRAPMTDLPMVGDQPGQPPGYDPRFDRGEQPAPLPQEMPKDEAFAPLDEAFAPLKDSEAPPEDQQGVMDELADILSPVDEPKKGAPPPPGMNEPAPEHEGEAIGEEPAPGQPEQQIASLPPWEPVDGHAFSLPQPTGTPLRDVDLLVAGRFRLGQPLEAENRISGIAYGKACISKLRGVIVFCVEPAEWPDEVRPYFDINTILYQGQNVVARYDDGRLTNLHALFPSDDLEAVVAHYTARFGPPTDMWKRRIAPLAHHRKDNPTVAWRSENSVTGKVAVLEIRAFDDARGGFPDTEHGALMLHFTDSKNIFPRLSTLDLMIMKPKTSGLNTDNPRDFTSGPPDPQQPGGE